MIDILMATYNGDRFLEEQLDSILQQSYQAWRLIIRDDGSSDGTLKILKRYQKKWPDKIKIVVSECPSGSAQNNFFQLMQYAEAEYIMFSDQDDVWLPNKIGITLQTMKQLEQCCGKNMPLLVHSDLTVVNENLVYLSKSLFDFHNMSPTRNGLNNLLVQNIVVGCTTMINSSLLKRVVVIPQNAVMHDMWIALIAAAFGKIGFVGESTMLYRQHGDNVDGAKDMKSVLYIVNRMTKLHQVRRDLRKQYLQAEEFSNIYEYQLSEEQKKLLRSFSGLQRSNALKRLIVLTQYALYKKGIVRKLGQIFV